MKIGIASDHAGFELKSLIKQYFANNYCFQDFGCYSLSSVDYPIYGKKLAYAISNKQIDLGIAICGSGMGIGISVNRIPNAYAVVGNNSYLVKQARLRFNANVIAIGARTTGFDLAIDLINDFLTIK